MKLGSSEVTATIPPPCPMYVSNAACSEGVKGEEDVEKLVLEVKTRTSSPDRKESVSVGPSTNELPEIREVIKSANPKFLSEYVEVRVASNAPITIPAFADSMQKAMKVTIRIRNIISPRDFGYNER
ncbi:hypothetical protein K2Y11_19115 [bacterium]|nr:hypothetical protein [bacterium]